MAGDNLDRRRISVEIVEALPSRLATHIRYKVRAKNAA